MKEHKIEIMIRDVKLDKNLFFYNTIIELEDDQDLSNIGVKASFIDDEDSKEDQGESNE